MGEELYSLTSHNPMYPFHTIVNSNGGLAAVAARCLWVFTMTCERRLDSAWHGIIAVQTIPANLMTMQSECLRLQASCIECTSSTQSRLQPVNALPQPIGAS